MDAIKEWLKQPFKEDGNAFDWFLFLGFTLAVTFLWSRILRYI